jgi:hypothetical protein
MIDVKRHWASYEWRGRHVILLHELRHAGPCIDPVEAILAGFERAGVNHGGEEGEGRECDGNEVDHFG